MHHCFFQAQAHKKKKQKKKPIFLSVPSLSPVLFIVNLEKSLKDGRKAENAHQLIFPTETSHADDIDFVGNDQLNVRELDFILQNHSIKVNVDKTEYTQIRKDFSE